MRSDRILLVGMMGSGKTTVGRALGDLLGWRYVDNDEMLEQAVGRSTRDVQEHDGEQALRRAESAALTAALDEGGPLVASIAAGVVTDGLDRARLRSGGFVVWLHATLQTLAERVEGTDRPWLGKDPAAALSELYAGREYLYSVVAHLTVEVDSLPADVVAVRIATEVARRGH
ncbi:MAG: AAA family ATPase [Frankiales bacterium]|nr:AAA family ATPase [Frankiales bacterium]